jgi:hypothetical protein
MCDRPYPVHSVDDSKRWMLITRLRSNDVVDIYVDEKTSKSEYAQCQHDAKMISPESMM